jgi:hypothetical protein|tara:strand:+ start:461 stop:754 length:294 start_codon:yes stop_codon:yes gene_type:complete
MVDARDNYGFKQINSYDRTRDNQTKSSKVDTKKIIYIILGSIIGLLWLISIIISGKYAWSEFPNDSNLVKLIRLWISVVFAPIYLFYIFIKTTVFKQ